MWNHVSSVSYCYNVADPSALFAYMLVNHMREACQVFFSIHSVKPWKRKLLWKTKIGHDKGIFIFLLFYHFLKKSLKIVSSKYTALCGWQVTLKWALGSNFIKIRQKIWSKQNFKQFFWKKILLWKKDLFYLEFLFSQRIEIFAFLKTSVPEQLNLELIWNLELIFFDFLISYFLCKKILNEHSSRWNIQKKCFQRF